MPKSQELARVSATRSASATVTYIKPGSGEGRLAVEVGGRGPAVVLIHGWAVDRRMWVHQLLAFRRHFTTITYDRRGFGQSTATADMSLELADLDTILAQLGISRVALLGMSQGGRIAARYALTRPQIVSALVLQGAPLDDAVPPINEPSVLPFERYAKLLQAGDRDAFLLELSAHPLMNAGPRSSQAQAEIMAMLRDYRGEDLLQQTAHPREAEPLLAADLRGIIAPTEVVTGSHELLWLRATSDRIARNIPGARRRVIRGGRHFVNMTHISYYNRCVLDFLSRATRTWSDRGLDSE